MLSLPFEALIFTKHRKSLTEVAPEVAAHSEGPAKQSDLLRSGC